jgi:hypothetical protein
VDNTLEQLEIMTDYPKLYIKTIWLVIGWFMIIILTTCGEAYWLKNQYNYNIIIAIYVPSILNYCTHINFLDDLIFASVLGLVYLITQISKNYSLICTNLRKYCIIRIKI